MNTRSNGGRASRLWCGMLCTCLLLGITTGSARHANAQTPSQEWTSQAALQVALELASDFSSADATLRQTLLEEINQQGNLSDLEQLFTYVAFAAKTDSHYSEIVAVQGTRTFDYLLALRHSYGRFKGAQAVSAQEWMATQLKASQQYAVLAADGLLAEAQLDARDASRLQQYSFATRRPAEQQRVFVERLRANGLSPDHIKLLRDSGRSDGEIEEFLKTLLQTAPDQVGISAVDALYQIATVRRQLAAELQAYAKANPANVAGLSTAVYTVGNPHDQEETVDLYIRRISIPEDWQLSIVPADVQVNEQGATATVDRSKPVLREVEPGKHYAVTLRPKAEIQVASVLVPTAEVGANTSARWAVEGKIGDELIGGIVHEMNVPSIISDFQLPPVGSAPNAASQTNLPAQNNLLLFTIAAVSALAMGFIGILLFARRRRTQSQIH